MAKRRILETALSVGYWLLSAKIFLEIHRFVGFHFDLPVIAINLLFVAYLFLCLFVLAPLAVFCGNKTADFIQRHWR